MYFDTRCRLCLRTFPNSERRDKHETRLCLTKSVLLCSFYGRPLSLAVPVSNDYSDNTQDKMEHEYCVSQATQLLKKHLDDGNLFEKDGLTDDSADKPKKLKNMAQYLVSKSEELVKKKDDN